MPKLRKHLFVEHLEGRDVPTTWSVPWDDPAHLTVSFAPDGTDVAGRSSTLFSDMKADGFSSTTDWQAVILKALNTWSSAAGVRFTPTFDMGLPLGTQGAAQGDMRFGDIRIASRPLTSNLAAMASPFTWTGSTWAGDIVLNSDAKFSTNGAAGTFDLYSVVLHEAGHALGLDGNYDPTSAMFEQYVKHPGLSTQDVLAIQALYGEPLATPTSTPTFQSIISSFLKSWSTSYTNTYGQYSGSLTSTNKPDVYAVTAPAAISSDPMNLIVYVRAKDSTLGLTPQLAVTDAQKRPVAFEVISNLQGWISVQVRGVKPGAQYNLEVFANELDGKTLNYGMAVNFNQDPPVQRNLIAANTLSAKKTTDNGTLTLSESRLVSFSLASTWVSDMNVQMTVTDSKGKVVAQLTSGPNELPPTSVVFLDAGSYNITYRVFSPTGKKLRSVQFAAMIEVMNDPVGTYAPTSTTSSTTRTESPPTYDPSSIMSILLPPDYTYSGTIDPYLSPIYLYYY